MLRSTAEKLFSNNIHFTTYHSFHRDSEGTKKVLNDFSNKWKEHNTHSKSFEEVYNMVPREPVGLGIICGEKSQIFVLDFDDKDLAKEIMGKFPDDKNTMFQETKKGYHFFYKFDKSFANRKIGLGGLKLDLISGDTLLYHFPNDGYSMRENKEIKSISDGLKKYLLELKEKTFEDETKEKTFKDTPKGGRNNALFKFLSGVQGNQNPSHEELTDAAIKWNNEQSNPLPKSEVLKTLNSVSKSFKPEGEKPTETSKKKKIELDNQYYNFWYNPLEDRYIKYSVVRDEVDLQMNKQVFTQFMGLNPKDCTIPNRFHHFSFDSPRFDNVDYKDNFNEYKAPEHMGFEYVKCSDKFKALFDRFFMHISCNDNVIANYFIQWVAYLYKNGKTPRTAILMRGVEGTGKGTLFNMLSNLFASEYVMRLTHDIVKTGFNSFLERNRVLFIDEMPDNDGDLKSFSNSLKSYVTDEKQTINEKYAPLRQARINAALLVASNYNRSLAIGGNDRRWTIIPYNQNEILSAFTHEELELLNGESIAEELAKYLSCVKVNNLLVEKPLDTEAKAKLKEYTVSVSQNIVNAMTQKDFNYFYENIEDNKLLHQINSCFSESKIPTNVIVEIFKTAGKHVTNYNIHNYLRNTDFNESFEKKVFKMPKIDEYYKAGKTYRGYGYKEEIFYDLDYANGEVIDKKTLVENKEEYF